MADNDAFQFEVNRSFVTAHQDDESSIVELALTGFWDCDPWLQAHRMAHKCLTSHPAGLLLNLLGLHDPHAASAPLWFAIEALAHRMNPPVPVAACVRDDSALAFRLNRLGARRRLAVFPGVSQAREALAGDRPLTDQVRLDFPPESESVTVAEQIVDAACHEWDLTGMAKRARLVVSELMCNAVEHAGTSIHLTVTRLGRQHTAIVRRHNHLRLAVYDQQPWLPPLPHGPPPQLWPTSERGQGLHIVDAAADHWGALPTRNGKVVWAVLRDRSQSPPSPPASP